MVGRETHHGVDIHRANGTRLRPARFAGRVSNYLSYFAAATAASFNIGRPDVVVSLTDPPIVGLAALWAARRTGARFVFLCEDIFPEVATLLEDFQNETVNSALDRVNRYLLRARRRDRRARRSHAPAAGRGEGRRPGAGARDSQLGRLRGDRAGAEGQRLLARARPRRPVRGDAFRQRRPVAESRRADRGRRSAPLERAADDRHRRRRIEAALRSRR